MTYSILIFAYRKPGTTPEQFQSHYEGKHVSLIKEISGEYVPILPLFNESFIGFSWVIVYPDGMRSLERLFPLSHTRRYIHRTEGKTEDTERNANFPATILLGSQTDFAYDAFAELSFADGNAFQTFFGHCQQPENAARIAADEEHFLDRSRTTIVVLGETFSTTK
ncbi:hypothetical protein Daus18300_011855 [Diaporthe australafricana]|uniref:EthD domain-containing protein n=1 Tax=Diaporthe australafricana TaxID=127596 RepID=A0ABR3W4Z7_9PEZI